MHARVHASRMPCAEFSPKEPCGSFGENFSYGRLSGDHTSSSLSYNMTKADDCQMHMERMVNMSWWKNCFLVATGVVAGALLYETVMSNDTDNDCDEDDEAEEFERDGVEILIEKVRREATLAMAQCENDEEREAVYAQVKSSVQEIQDALAKKGEALIEQLKEEAEQQGEAADDGVDRHVQDIKAAMQQVRESLEDTLESLKPAAPEPAL